jgi:integrase
MSDHIEKRRNLWYATLTVPAKHREALQRRHFRKSLGTSDKRRAKEKAQPLVAMWKATIRQLEGEHDAIRKEALSWRGALLAERAAGAHDNVEALELILTDEAEKLEAREGQAKAQEFYAIASCSKTLSEEHIPGWEASIAHLGEKNRDQQGRDLREFVARFSFLEDATEEALEAWVEKLRNEGTTEASLKRQLGAWRGFWRHLEKVKAVKPKSAPFALVKPEAPRATKKARGWAPFEAEDIPKLWAAALDRKDTELADLITVAAYSGARIEELCALQWGHVGAASFRVVDAKTEAGIREVPIHAALVPLLERLRAAEAKRGKGSVPATAYVFTDLTFNKYGDRSNAIGKRFGRLKAALGYGERHVFHSIRKTVVTLLERAGVPENVAADIVGHDKPNITFGLYSGGNALETKAKALALVGYPGATG